MKIIKAGCLENDILFFPVPDVIPPFFNQLLHICRNFRVEREAFSCRGMFKSQGFGMEGLPGTNAETVIDELFVFGKVVPLRISFPPYSLSLNRGCLMYLKCARI